MLTSITTVYCVRVFDTTSQYARHQTVILFDYTISEKEALIIKTLGIKMIKQDSRYIKRVHKNVKTIDQQTNTPKNSLFMSILQRTPDLNTRTGYMCVYMIIIVDTLCIGSQPRIIAN